ncbi:hypothetical protein K493DRAFT_309829 [Basidiobolus meristosporus CBS 931.73]|uniref:DNA polymerase delta subunit 3 n=1 Tax=Basidiobolus meristosporus CBS 931.73 TaxID=1314790 RepID=A0A1Y1ZDZ9_9FUNG|nr:hypothetical protein K493DRAFT_309829 [Basidiobolus meristosporus CBS 931.73]|eukprot:ORY08414.1 hypothetical protein K493DRAFT_309829 [Basidiobolus meristosporus CBS 931.73]
MDLLRELICEDKSIVTYKWLSRQLRIPANDAKKLLYQFITESTDQVHCIYCISGFLLVDESHHIILVPQEDLEITKKKFSKITGVHVYSVQASRPKSGAVLLATQKPVDDPTNPAEYASIVNVKVKIIDRQKAAKPAEVVPKKTHLGSQNTPGGNVELIPGKPLAPEKKPTEKKPAPTSEKKPVEKKPPAKSVNSFFGSTKSKKQPAPKKDEMEVEDEEPVVERRKRTRKVKSILPSDDEEMVDATKPTSPNPEPEVDVTSVPATPEETSVDIDVDEKVSTTQEPPNTNGKRKRGRRRIQKKRTYKNDRGYMVTEDVYEWESCTDEEPEANHTETPKAPKAKPKKELGGEKKGKPAQKNLMSFWGKK